MKRLLFLLLIVPILSFSQCPPSHTFSSQAQIDALATDYPDCTELSYLVIDGDDITDLSGLNQITNANTLTIQNNPLLQTLDGLNTNLFIYHPFQESLIISNNDALTDISSLETTQISAGVDMYVTISDNPSLISLVGMQGLDYATTFLISNNDALIDIGGIGENIGELTITGNDSLIDLSGLHNFLSEYLTISNNLSLQSFNTLGITGAEYLFVNNNPNLIDISLPENSGANSIEIENNMNLSVCNVDYICNYLATSPPLFAVQLNDNAPGCNSYVEVEYACGLIPRNDDCNSIYPTILEIGESISINNELATESVQVPSCNDLVDRQDVWAIFNSGDLTSIDITVDSGFNIQLWEGNCSSLVQVSDACGSEMLVDIPVTQDTYYTAQIWSDDTGRRASGWFDILVQDSTLSVDEFEQNDIKIYPNPAQNTLHIQSNKSIEKVEVYNLLGQQVLESKATILDVSNLIEGLYLVKVFCNGIASTYKIVKQ